MSKVSITKTKLDTLANTIAAKSGVAAPLTLDQMDTAVRNIPTGGITPTGNINITQAGQTDVTNYATATVAFGTEGTPTATKGSVSNHSVSVTPSVTNTTGYITGGTKTGTAVTVSASELVSGTYTVDSSGTKDVTNYASASVPAGTAGTPSATKGTVSNHSISVTPSVTNTTGYITGSTISGTAVTVNVTELESGTKSITENGTGISVSGYSAVDVNVAGQTPTGVKYIYTELDGEGGWNVSGYEYCSVDGAPVLDGHLRLWLDLTSITDPLSMSITIGLNREQGAYSIDWGDGTTPDSVSTSAFTNKSNHTYSAAGLYVIDVTLTSGKLQLYSSNTYLTTYCIYIEARGLDPQVINGANFPGVSESGLKSIWFGNEITNPGTFPRNTNLESVRLSPQQSSIKAGFLDGCSALQKITIPASVSSLGKQAFANCSSMQEIHFLSTTPPTIATSGTSDSPFYNTPGSMVIYVPSASLSAYQSATNWSLYASQMVGE